MRSFLYSLFLVALPLPALAQDKPLPADWTTYRDSARQYVIGYPANWEHKFTEGAHFFISPKEKHDVFLENVNVVIQDLSAQPMTLDEFAAYSRDQINRMGAVSKVLSEKKTAVAGFPAVEMVSDFTYDGSATKVKSLFFIKGKEVFLLSYTALPETFEQWEAMGTQVLYSFRFGK